MLIFPWERLVVERAGRWEGDIIARRYRRILFRGRTRYSDVVITETPRGFKDIYMDGIIQSSTEDEFIYHESLVHPLLSRIGPKRVLILGGGEGATAREVLRYPVERVDMVEIDGEFVRIIREYVPEMCGNAFSDPRLNLHVTDAWDFVHNARDHWDAAIVDITEPYGPARRLYSLEFYEALGRVADSVSVFVGDADGLLSGGYEPRYISTVTRVFPHWRLAMVHVPSFFTSVLILLASKSPLPEKPRSIPPGLRSYDEEMDIRLFSLPRHVRAAIDVKRPPYTFQDLPIY